MQQSTQLAAQTRSADTKLARVRAAGTIPAVLYGHGVAASVPLSLPAIGFSKLYKRAGMSTIIDLALDDGAPRKVVVRDIQTDPLMGDIVHADLYAVNMDEVMEITVPLTFTGTSPAVKEHGGLLLRQMDEVTIRCLPVHLVHDIPVDLSHLGAIGDNIHGSDLVLPEGVTLVEDHDVLVVMIAAPTVQEEEETTAETSVEDIEVEKKGKKEEAGEEDSEKEGGKKE